MPTNYSDSFIALPQASGHLTAQQIELASINETAINEASIDAIGRGGGFSWGVGSVSGADDFGDAAFGGDFGAGAVSSTDAQKTALAQLRGQASALGQLRATGTFVSDLETKAVEGIQSLAGRFGQNIPFLSAGAKTPSFSSILGAGVGAVTGVIGSAFGGKKGLIPNSAINNLVATQEAKASARIIREEAGLNNPTEDKSHLVSLTSIIDGVSVEFLVMPEIVENRTVAYEPVAPVQFPGAFQKYKGTESPQWTLNATLISRTTDEASLNLKNVNILRAWTMPFFGENTRRAYPNRIGAPPPVLMLKGLREAMIGPIPVVITSLSWNWPKDVDYIPARSPDESAENVPFPTIIQIAIQCVESLSTTEFNRFNLDDYVLGKMIGAYRMPVAADRKENYGNEGRGQAQPPVVEAQSNTNFDSRHFPGPKVISEARTAAASAADAAGRVDDSWRGRGKRGVRFTTTR